MKSARKASLHLTGESTNAHMKHARVLSHAHFRSIYTTQNLAHWHTVVSPRLKSATPGWPRYLTHVHSHMFSFNAALWSCLCMHMCANHKWVTSDTVKSLYGPHGCIITFIFLYLFSSPPVPSTPHLCVRPVESEMWSTTWKKHRKRSYSMSQ